MKRLLAIASLSVLMLAAGCCNRGDCEIGCPSKQCDPIKQLNGSDQCVQICPPPADCREQCPPRVECVVEEVPVKCFRKRKICKTVQVGPMEFSCETDVIKDPQGDGNTFMEEDGDMLMSEGASSRVMRKQEKTGDAYTTKTRRGGKRIRNAAK